MTTDPERARVERGLRRCAKSRDKHKPALEAVYAERNALYAEGDRLGVSQVQLAVWAGSTPEAVAKALRKLRENGAGHGDRSAVGSGS